MFRTTAARLAFPIALVAVSISIVGCPLSSTTIPDVVGQTRSTAEETLVSAGYAVNSVLEQYSDTVPEGQVISQYPEAGTSAASGTAVMLLVSLGPATSSSTTVPNVVGEEEAAAKWTIIQAGLTVGTVTQQNDSTVPAGDVISQDPAAGESRPEGTAVALLVSLGPVMVTVPDVVGETQTDAESAVTGVGLTVGTVTQEYSDTVPEGEVISQDPTAGTSVPEGSSVALVVSKGEAPVYVDVPDVVDKTQTDAESDITAAGLVVGTVTEEYSDAAPEGQVISQNPVAGTSVLEGSAVDLVVSKGPEELLYEGPRPGEFTPARNPLHRMLFHDDEIMVISSLDGNPDVEYMVWTPDDATLTSWSSSEYTLDQDAAADVDSKIAVASGRIVDPDYDQVVYAYYDPNGYMHIRLVQDGLTIKELLLDLPEAPSYKSIDLAVGDLDMVMDDDGQYHDEIVFLCTYTYEGDDKVGLLVFDSNLDMLATSGLTQDARQVAVALGDFDGDDSLEIAVAASEHQGTDKNHYTAFQFDVDESGDCSLTQGPFYSTWCQDQGMDIVGADLDGDGVDEVAMCADLGRNIRTYELDEDLVWTQKDEMNLDVNFVTDASIVAGLFFFDPNTGRGLHRRQLAVCQTRNPSGVDSVLVSVLEADTSLELSYVVYQTQFYGETTAPEYGSVDLTHANIATGNFTGHLGTDNAPTMDLMLSFTNIIHPQWGDDQSEQWLKCLRLAPGEFSGYVLNELYAWSGTAETCDDIPSTVVAYDRDGDAFVLGAPTHIVMQDLRKVDYIIQEPPKHLDYLPNDPAHPEGEWSVFKISARQDFYVELTDSSEQKMETKSTARSSWGLGGSVAVSSSATMEFGNAAIGFVETSLDVTTKLGYDYNEKQSTWDSAYTSHQLSQNVSTIDGDYVDGELQLIDVWRYRVHGLTTEEGENVFQDLVIPGPTIAFGAATGLGNSIWYQPVHVNKNILSYPASSSFVPTDLGWFSIPGEDDPIQELMNNGATNYTWGGVGQTISIKWTETAGSGSEKSYDHTLSESVDIAAGVKGKANIGPLGASLSTNVKVNIHSNQSWGESEIASNTSSNTTGISMVVPFYPSDAGQNYTFKTAIYSTTNGTFKVAHATDPLGEASGAEWYAGQYGRAYDLGLNLPSRFQYNSGMPTSYYTVNENHTRMHMRGCFLRETEVNPDTGEKNLFSGVLRDGDVVEVAARVYNFTLKPGETDQFDVLFECIAVDPVTMFEVGERQTIGTASTTLGPVDIHPSICQSPMKEVAVEWDTTGLGGRTMRLYVTVDPTDAVPGEIHEWKVDGERIPSGNNEGYWPWGTELPVLSAESGSSSGAAKSAEQPLSILVDENALAIKTPEGLNSDGSAPLVAGQTYALRAHLQTNRADDAPYNVLFSDGHPARGGKTIALKLVRGLNAGDSYVWAEWTPGDAGEHMLWVSVLNGPDSDPADVQDRLRVIVK